ncbi:unnamed protein product [Polarella glacialis]|uniref:Uncharacterized protein n=1 Tax=Polarella glacialis TaxID=89957 RepID=A0A813LT59_POLGL|nr:unnamed protein product [Polarella glacialis]CAE8739108.1 unnamed protein product [Polarella glacialis]
MADGVMADEETEYGFFKWLLYVILFIAQLIVLLNNVGLMSYWIRSFGKLFKHGGIRGFSLRSEFGSMSIVLPCFMPNEHLIVKDHRKQATLGPSVAGSPCILASACRRDLRYSGVSTTCGISTTSHST